MPAILQASLPRSGNHLLIKLLWDAMPYGSFVSCEYYTAPNCCKQIPCLNVDPSVFGQTSSSETNLPGPLFVHKTHDFELSDVPTSGYSALFQYRDPLQYLISHFTWEVTNMADFSIGSAIDFAIRHSLYYIRMHLKWSVLYADLLLVPPLAYESLCSLKGKSSALQSICSATGLNLSDEQLAYSLDESRFHSHTGDVYKSSVIEKAVPFFEGSDLIPFFNSAAAQILELLPCLSKSYSVNVVHNSFKRRQLLPAFQPTKFSPTDSTQHYLVDLAARRHLLDGAFSGRPIWVSGTGISEAYADGSYLEGSIVLLPLRLACVTSISAIDILVRMPESRSSENYSFMLACGSRIALMHQDKIIGSLNAQDGSNSMRCRVLLADPIIPASDSLLLALGFRLQDDHVSHFGVRRQTLFASEIQIRIN